MNKKISLVFVMVLMFTPLVIFQSFGESDDIMLKNPNEGRLADFIYIENNTTGFSTREIKEAYSIANGDVEEAIKILQHSDYPDNVKKTPEYSYLFYFVILIGIPAAVFYLWKRRS